MPVSPRVRQIEREIDDHIGSLTIWRQPKDCLLAQIMSAYRDAIEVVFAGRLMLEAEGNANDISSRVAVLFAEEQRYRAGTLWALKWAAKLASTDGPPREGQEREIVDLLLLGARYEAFVDLLRAALHDVLEIHVVESTRTLVCYEGERRGAFGADVVEWQRLTSPSERQISLTEDSDRLTSRWCASDYRRVTAALAARAAEQEDALVVGLKDAGGRDVGELRTPRPAVVRLFRPEWPDSEIFDDLVLPTTGPLFPWKLAALLDTPVVKIGDRYCALSSDLRAVAGTDDHMLRLAALVDEAAYNVASPLRETRMMALCQSSLEQASPPWSVRTGVKLTNPKAEADVLATRGTESIVLELKSTLRPETPWEVRKRNEDIACGIRQARDLVARGAAVHAFVLTDGYRGDYAVWPDALANNVAIGTLDDLEQIARDPLGAPSFLASAVGILPGSTEQSDQLPDREEQLAGWNIRLVDAPAPAKSSLT
jgi:hypothetical protein